MEVIFSSSILYFWFGSLSFNLKFQEDPISGCWDIQLWYFEVVFHWRSSSFQAFLIQNWSPEIKFTIWGRFDQWLLIYSTFNTFRVSSIKDHLHFKYFWFWLSPLNLSLYLEEDPISGCWCIQLWRVWCRLPLDIIFILSIFFGPLSLSLKLEDDSISGCWDI